VPDWVFCGFCLAAPCPILPISLASGLVYQG